VPLHEAMINPTSAAYEVARVGHQLWDGIDLIRMWIR
jgi:hypothetical protein